MSKKLIVFGIIVVVAALAGVYAYHEYKAEQELLYPKFYSGNGRLEATEVNIAAKLPERIEAILVDEGDYVTKGDVLVKMQTNALEADLQQAAAQKLQAEAQIKVKDAYIRVCEAELTAAKATLAQETSNFKGAKQTFDRQAKLINSGSVSRQIYEDAETKYLAAQGKVAEAEAKVMQAEANLLSAKAEKQDAEANLKSAISKIGRITEDIKDSVLKAPRDGRVQYRISQEGEVLSSGGRVLNMVDLVDVYMTFFLPENVAGKLKIGSEVFIVLDSAPDAPIPASVTFVDAVAQFTPKTVETKVERQKLMFRVKAHISPVLLQKHREYVKTGLPGVAWVKVDDTANWSDSEIAGIINEADKECKKYNLDLFGFFKEIKDNAEKRKLEDAAKVKARSSAVEMIKASVQEKTDKLINGKDDMSLEKLEAGLDQNKAEVKQVKEEAKQAMDKAAKANAEKAKVIAEKNAAVQKAEAAKKAEAPKAAAPAKDASK